MTLRYMLYGIRTGHGRVVLYILRCVSNLCSQENPLMQLYEAETSFFLKGKTLQIARAVAGEECGETVLLSI